MANERLYEDMEPRKKFDALWLKAGLHKRPGADALLYDLEKQGFFDLPASIKHHSNRFGGLATHTVNVADSEAIELLEDMADDRFTPITEAEREKVRTAIRLVAKMATVRACPKRALHAAIRWIVESWEAKEA